MDAVMLVEALDIRGQVQTRQRFTGAGTQCRIGRSLGCDVVINDVYAAPEHTLLTLLEDGKVRIEDLGTRNGTRVEGQRIDAAGQTFSGGELRIGRTRVLVRTQLDSLPPERLFRRNVLRRNRTTLAAVGLALCFAFAAFLQWTDAPERLGPRVLIAELVAVCGLAVWVGFWSLVSRLTVDAWHLRIHLAIAAVCVGLWAWGYALYVFAAFALQWSWLGVVTGLVAAGIACAAAYLHLRNATQFLRPVSWMLAALAPLLLGTLWWLVDMQVDPRTVNRVTLGAKVFPSSWRLAPSTDLGDYMADDDELKRAANRNRQESLLASPLLDAED